MWRLRDVGSDEWDLTFRRLDVSERPGRCDNAAFPEEVGLLLEWPRPAFDGLELRCGTFAVCDDDAETSPFESWDGVSRDIFPLVTFEATGTRTDPSIASGAESEPGFNIRLDRSVLSAA
jgi:hypothetical protein